MLRMDRSGGYSPGVGVTDDGKLLPTSETGGGREDLTLRIVAHSYQPS